MVDAETAALATTPFNARPYVLIALAVSAVLGTGFFIWRTYFDTYHYAVVDPGVLYRDGYRTTREFNLAIKNAKAATVISLLDEKEYAKPPHNEWFDFIRRSDIRGIAIGVKLGGWPTTEQVNQFLNEVATPNRRPVLVHCAQGIRRTGMFVAAYQMTVLKWDRQRTKDAILRFGHSDRTVGDIQRFIDCWDPETRQIVGDLGKPSSKE